jgi:5-(carboxyamino)imidazole ribonucleotide synthase
VSDGPLVAILGGGQLGRMMALAGYPMGFRFRLQDARGGASSSAVAEVLQADYHDDAALARTAEGAIVVTYEFENVPVDAATTPAGNVPVRPPPQALEVAQDRLVEKTFFRDHDIDTADFVAVDTRADLEAAVAEIGLPAVLKTRRLGYDGKGQALLRRSEDVGPAFDDIGGVPLILEAFIDFRRELSVLAVRGTTGETAFYPLVENHHLQGILHLSHAPAPDLRPGLQATAEGYATRVLEALDYVGVLAVELFETKDSLLANEMAPRVHNSGHWTIEGAETSQFENHIRAVTGMPLGSTAPRGHSAMLNILGALPETAEVLAVPHTHLHLYGKGPRPGRKIGHVTIRADDPDAVHAALERLEHIIVPELEAP